MHRIMSISIFAIKKNGIWRRNLKSVKFLSRCKYSGFQLKQVKGGSFFSKDPTQG